MSQGDPNSQIDTEQAPEAIRRLFLDDDPARAQIFLEKFPDAVWVTSVPECLERLSEFWHEVHLDHDLGGQKYVDVSRDDCGMAIVRWLAYEPRRHLRDARFFVHSHNGPAAYVMLLQIKSLGYRVAAHPFGTQQWHRGLAPAPSPGSRKGWLRRVLGRVFGKKSNPSP